MGCKSNPDCMCNLEYSPVCGYDGVEYSNACEADCAGVEYAFGTCPIDAIGQVNYLGDPEKDGCGWVIRIGESNFHPTNLSEEFKKSGSFFQITYKRLEVSFSCSMTSNIEQIEILSISVV